MDFIDPILSIAEKLYALCNEVKANKKRCRRLGERMLALTDLVKIVKNQGLGNQPDLVTKCLDELKTSLELAEKMVKKYTESITLKRIVKAYEMSDDFETLNMRLNDAAQQLSLAFQVEHREKIAEIINIFQEDKRRKEDEDDKKRDREELLNCRFQQVFIACTWTVKKVNFTKWFTHHYGNYSVKMSNIFFCPCV